MLTRRRHNALPASFLMIGELWYRVTHGPNHPRSSSRRRRADCRRLIVSAIVLWGSLIALSQGYMLFQSLTFTNPCQLARETKLRLAQSPRTRWANTESAHIPKIIHQQWKDENVPIGDFSTYHAEWKRIFPEPEYMHILWTDVTGRKVIADHFPWFLHAFDSYPLNIQRADSMRYFILYMYGGVYVDLDYEPFVNFWDALPNDRVSIVESPYWMNERVQNSLIASPARDPLWNVTFEVIYERRQYPRVLESTGPSAMDAVIDRAGENVVHILPCQNFQRTPLGEAGKSTPVIAGISRAIQARTPLVKTCGDWSRRDDCQFALHHNAITYMAQFRTTLRSFLSNL